MAKAISLVKMWEGANSILTPNCDYDAFEYGGQDKG
jgi:hypothetical protein